MRDLKYEKRQARGAAVVGIFCGAMTTILPALISQGSYGYAVGLFGVLSLSAFATYGFVDEIIRRFKMNEEEIAGQRQLMDDQYDRIIALETSLGECLSVRGLVPPASEFTPRIVK